MNRVGITSIHDIARVDEISQQKLYDSFVERSHTDLDIFLDLKKQGRLTVRVYAFLPLRQKDDLAARGIRPGAGDDWVRFGALKEFADNGYMFEPLGKSAYRGGWTFRMISEEFMAEQIKGADALGFDVGMHVLGDKALNSTLNWYQASFDANGPRADRRFRIIHVWYAKPDDLERAGKMHLIADVTPFQLLEHWDMTGLALGPDRAKTAFAWRTLIDTGVRLNLVSDLPGLFNRTSIAPFNPLVNMYYAVTRKNLAGAPAGGWHPEQRITIEEAVAAYTINPAFSSREEVIKGSIAEGKLADLVVVSKNIFEIEPEALLSTEVLYTIVGGTVVYQK